MSNIFEIDGEIEDNNDEGNGDGEKKRKEQEQIDDSNSEEQLDSESEEVNQDSSDDDDIPWYDKVLSGKGDEETDTVEDSNDDSVSISTDESTTPAEDYDEKDEPEYSADENEADLSDDDDVSEEEINEVLSELEDSEEALKEDEEELNKLEETSPGTKGSSEEDSEEREEEFDEIFPPRKKNPVSIATLVFAFLFLATLSLLSYYQFYDGEKFDFTFVHKSEDGPSKSQQLDNELQNELGENKELREQLSKMTEDFRATSAKLQKLQKDAENQDGSQDVESDSAPETQDVQLSPLPQEGTFYQVQLMALKEFQPQFSASNFRLSVERENGFTKYLVGPFQKEGDVKTFYQKIRKSGFGDAFIVKKEEGERVPYSPFK